MKKTIMAMAIATAASGSAVAADLPRGPAPYYPPPASVYNWTGPYAGLNLGYEWGKVTNNVTEPSGIAGGGQIGYNWQMGQFVFGVETDIQISGADDTFAPYKFSNPWFGTLRGRAGFAINNVMLYGTAGLAYGELKGEFFGLEEDKTLVGWTAGAGIEYGVYCIAVSCATRRAGLCLLTGIAVKISRAERLRPQQCVFDDML